MNNSTDKHLGAITPMPMNGDEPLRFKGKALKPNLGDFWRWSVSDLLSNATRGRLAEFIVATALGCAAGVRDEWQAYDLVTAEGIKIEVKSAGYLQSWAQRELSKISFDVKKTLAWDRQENRQAKTATRQADIYVFALHAHQHKPTADPLNLDQWQFFVVPTAVLNARTRSQYSITLATLLKLKAGPVGYDGLAETVLGQYNAWGNS